MTGSLSIFTPEALEEAEKSGKLDIDSNLLDLRPDPAHFVGFLKTMNRPEVLSSLFARLLEAYRGVKLDNEGDPLRCGSSPYLSSFCPDTFRRTLLYLQLIVQIQARLADTSSSTNMLKKPEHILVFVKHALEDAQMPRKSQMTVRKRTGLGLDDLMIISDSGDEDEIGSGDSDDEDEGSANAAPDEITVTTLNLLLALLEGKLLHL